MSDKNKEHKKRSIDEIDEELNSILGDLEKIEDEFSEEISEEDTIEEHDDILKEIDKITSDFDRLEQSSSEIKDIISKTKIEEPKSLQNDAKKINSGFDRLQQTSDEMKDLLKKTKTSVDTIETKENYIDKELKKINENDEIVEYIIDKSSEINNRPNLLDGEDITKPQVQPISSKELDQIDKVEKLLNEDTPSKIKFDLSIPIEYNDDKKLDLEPADILDEVVSEKKPDILNIDKSNDTSVKPVDKIEVSKETTRVEKSKEPTRVEISKEPTRVEKSKEPTRVEKSKETTRVEISKEPTRVEKSKEPTRVEKSKEPTREEISKEPTREEKSKEPTREEINKEPTREEKSKEPTREEINKEPTREEINKEPARVEKSKQIDKINNKKRSKSGPRRLKPVKFTHKMKIGVTRFPGTNNENESIRALESFGVSAEIINSFDIDKISNLDGIWIAGGFSYADVLRAGAVASVSDMMKEIKKHSKPILGICNGFQILTESNLLPGSLIPNKSTKFICDWIHVKIPENDSYLSNLAGATLRLPIAHFEGNLYAESLNDVKPYQIAQYSNFKGLIKNSFNPNGSIGNIAGLGKKNIVGMMPHPERASFSYQGSTDGRRIIDAFLREAKR